MSAGCEIKPDFTLRYFLSHPETVDRSVRRSPGFAAMRALVAMLDAAQMVVTCVLTASVFVPHRAIEAAGIGLIGAALAMAMRRALRPTTSVQRVTIAGAAQRAGFAVLVACTIMLAIIVLVGGLAHATELGPWMLSWGVLSAGISYLARALPVPALRRVMLRAIQPTVAIVGDPASAQIMADMLARQGNHRVTDQ